MTVASVDANACVYIRSALVLPMVLFTDEMYLSISNKLTFTFKIVP